jgi:hypothetical protein
MSRKRRDGGTRRLFAAPSDEEQWVSIGANVAVYRGEEAWRVVHVAEVLYEFAADDVATKRLCMAQLSLQKLASEGEIAKAFGCSRPTLCRAKAAFVRAGTPGLVPKRRGPKSPRMEPGLEETIVRLRRAGGGYRSIARRLGIPRSTVYAACKRHGLRERDRQGGLAFQGEGERETEGRPAEGDAEGQGAASPEREQEAAAQGSEVAWPAAVLGTATEVAPGEPAPARTLERLLACVGRLGQPEANPVFVSGSEVPAAGVLMALALVAHDGCLEAARRVYGGLSNGFYGLRTLVLTLLVNAWLGVKTLEALRHGSPHVGGRVLGLDRLPEAKTVRRKLGELAGRGLARDLMAQMAERRIQANRGLCAVLYVDGHVREYRGRRRVAKGYVARRHTSMPAIEDWWVHDAAGEPVVKIPRRLDSSLVRIVPEIVRDARRWLGKGRPLTVVFDRGGWSPKLFAALAKDGVRIVTYRKGRRRAYPLSEFDREVALPARGRGEAKLYRCRDRHARIQRHRFRSVTVLGKRTHQTEIITTDEESKTAVIVSEIFSQWSQENYFKYERRHRALDGLGSYAFEPVDDDVEVRNPAHRELDRQAKAAQARLRELGAGPKKRGASGPTAAQLRWWRRRVANLEARRRATPRRIRVGDLPEDLRPEQPNSERKLFTDVLHTSASRVETRPLGLLAGHYKSTYKDGRQFLRQVLANTGDLTMEGDLLTITLNPLASPHQTTALVGLCGELNGLHPTFPQTKIRRRFGVHEHP